MTNNSSVWINQVSAELQSIELRGYDNHPEAGDVHAAELESLAFMAECRLTRPAGNVIKAGSHL